MSVCNVVKSVTGFCTYNFTGAGRVRASFRSWGSSLYGLSACLATILIGSGLRLGLRSIYVVSAIVCEY